MRKIQILFGVFACLSILGVLSFFKLPFEVPFETNGIGRILLVVASIVIITLDHLLNAKKPTPIIVLAIIGLLLFPIGLIFANQHWPYALYIFTTGLLTPLLVLTLVKKSGKDPRHIYLLKLGWILLIVFSYLAMIQHWPAYPVLSIFRSFYPVLITIFLIPELIKAFAKKT